MYHGRAVASGSASPALARPRFAQEADFLKIKADILHTLPDFGEGVSNYKPTITQ